MIPVGWTDLETGPTRGLSEGIAPTPACALCNVILSRLADGDENQTLNNPAKVTLTQTR